MAKLDEIYEKLKEILQLLQQDVPVVEELNLEKLERRAILEALERSGWVQNKAARLLGVSPRALNYKIQHHDIRHPSWWKQTEIE